MEDLRARWENQAARIQLIVDAIQAGKDWTLYLGEFEHEGKSYSEIPWIHEVQSFGYTNNPMDMRGIDLFDVRLEGCFLGGVSFQFACLHAVDFSRGRMGMNNTNFDGARLLACNFHESDLCNASFQRCVISECDFTGARLHRCRFDSSSIQHCLFTQADVDGANFTKAAFLKPVFDHVILSESTELGFSGVWEIFEPKNSMMETERQARDGEFDKGKISSQKEAYFNVYEIYRDLKIAAKNLGLNNLAGNLHYRERKCRRHSYSKKMGVSRVWGFLEEVLIGYGEKPFRTIGVSAVLIVLFSFLYLFLGFEYSTSSQSIYVCRNPVTHPLELADIFSDVGLSLYLSVETFTTLGYGDVRPIGASRVFATMEALLGVVLMSLFVATLSRVMIRD